MENKVSSWEKLISLMQSECNLLQNFAQVTKNLRGYIQIRDWPSIEQNFLEIDKMSEELILLEEQRARINSEFTEEENLVLSYATHESEYRQKFNQIKSELRARLISVQASIRNLSNYAKLQDKLSREVLEELFPSMRGSVYNQNGKKASDNGKPMILSRHL